VWGSLGELCAYPEAKRNRTKASISRGAPPSGSEDTNTAPPTSHAYLMTIFIARLLGGHEGSGLDLRGHRVSCGSRVLIEHGDGGYSPRGRAKACADTKNARARSL
jgi:hypothetical protein